MNYEKAYKEALERMKSWARGEHPECFSEAKKAAEFIFPELKESEDERISREITEFLVDFNNGEYERPNENTIDSWLSWLEKQCNKKPIEEYDVPNTPIKDKESNLSKYLKSNHDVLDKVVDIITDIISCKDCPAKKFCDTFPMNERECVDIFKEWSLKEE